MIATIFETLEPMSLVVLRWLGWSLLLGTTLAGAAWLVTRLSRRVLSSALVCALWIIVLLKFVVPDGPGFAYSASSLVRALSGDRTANADRVLPVAAAGDAEYTTEYLVYPVSAAGNTQAVAETTKAAFPWLTAIAALYLAGVAAVATYRYRRYRAFRRECLAFEQADLGTQHLVHEIADDIGVRPPREIRISDDNSSLIIGGFRSVLVLSRRALADERELEAVIAHELAHLRRADFLIRYLQWAVGTLLFFWPVVAWVNRRIDLAREHACDEWALRHGRLTPSEYARCLLHAVGGSPAGRGYAPAAMASHPKWVERRIDMILTTVVRRRAGFLGALTGTALVGAWGVFALSGAVIEKEEAPAQQNEVVIISDDLAETGNFQVFESADGSSFTFEIADGGTWVTDAQSDGNSFRHMIALAKQSPSQQRLANLYERAPVADVNNDGNLSQSEHDAYYTALALRNPQGVIAAFPHTDRDENGTLSPSEAARWVTGTDFNMRGAKRAVAALPMIADGEVAQGVFVAAPHVAHNTFVVKDADAAEHVAVFEFNKDDAPNDFTWHTNDDGELPVVIRENTAMIALHPDGEENTFVFRADGDDAERPAIAEILVEQLRDADLDGDPAAIKLQVQSIADALVEDGSTVRVEAIADGDLNVECLDDGNVRIMTSGMCPSHVAATAWLEENVDAAVSAEEIAELIATVEDAPNGLFLELNPAADANGDGVLTAEEKHAFLDGRMAELHNKILGKLHNIPAAAHGVLRERLHAVLSDAKSATATADGGTTRMRTVVIEDGQVKINGEVVDPDNLPDGVHVNIVERD